MSAFALGSACEKLRLRLCFSKYPVQTCISIFQLETLSIDLEDVVVLPFPSPPEIRFYPLSPLCVLYGYIYNSQMGHIGY